MEHYVLPLVDHVCGCVALVPVHPGCSSIRVSSNIRFGWVKEVKEDVSVAAPIRDEPKPSVAANTQGDSPSVSSSPPQDNHYVPLAEAFRPQFTMARILPYLIWRTAVDGLPNADSKSISASAMNLSRCGHIQHIMVRTSDENINFTGICCAEMKKNVQYKLALTISHVAIIHAECECPAGKGTLATC